MATDHNQSYYFYFKSYFKQLFFLILILINFFSYFNFIINIFAIIFSPTIYDYLLLDISYFRCLNPINLIFLFIV